MDKYLYTYDKLFSMSAFRYPPQMHNPNILAGSFLDSQAHLQGKLLHPNYSYYKLVLLAHLHLTLHYFFYFRIIYLHISSNNCFCIFLLKLLNTVSYAWSIMLSNSSSGNSFKYMVFQ